MIHVNHSSVKHLTALIKNGKVNRDSSWSFSAEDGNAILGEDNWEAYANVHLATDDENEAETKGFYKYPVAKGGNVYRSGVIAAKQRAAQNNQTDIAEVADKLLQLIDGKPKKSIGEFLKKLLGIPAEKRPSSNFAVLKSADGNEYRWFGWVTNKWLDREGDIITDAAHVEFCKFLDEHPERAPHLWIWHTKGTATENPADWWDYTNGFFMYSGILTESETKAYASKPDEPIGMSHGFRVWEQTGRYITKYRTFEVSELPLVNAANPFTDFQIKEENQSMFTQRKRNYLVQRLGEDVVAKLEQQTESREDILKEQGVDWKEITAQYEEELEQAFAEKVEKAAQPTVERIIKELEKAMAFDKLLERLNRMDAGIAENASMVETVKELQEGVAHLLKSEDDRIAAAMTPEAPFDWSLAATVSEENIVEDEEVPENVKEFDWMNEVFSPAQQGK